MPLTWKFKLVFILVLVIATFLAGYIPVALETRNLNSELAAMKDRLQLLSLQGELGMVLIEAGQKNFGTAGEHSTRFFNQVREMILTVGDEAIKAKLQAILDRRDEINADLASFNPETDAKLQAVYRELYLAGGR